MTNDRLLSRLNALHTAYTHNNPGEGQVGRKPALTPREYTCSFGERLFLDVIGVQRTSNQPGLNTYTSHLEATCPEWGTRIAYRQLFTLDGWPEDPILQQRATLLCWAAGVDPKPLGLGAGVFPRYVNVDELRDTAVVP